MELPVTLPYPAEAINGRIIRFRVRAASGNPPTPIIAEGQGLLVVSSAYEKAGMFVATIDITIWPETTPGTVRIHTVPLDQSSVNCIRILPQPEGDVELECVDPSLPN